MHQYIFIYFLSLIFFAIIRQLLLAKKPVIVKIIKLFKRIIPLFKLISLQQTILPFIVYIIF